MEVWVIFSDLGVIWEEDEKIKTPGLIGQNLW